MTQGNPVPVPVPGDAYEGSWPDQSGPERRRTRPGGAPRGWAPRRLLAPAAAVSAVLAVLAGGVIARDSAAGRPAAGPQAAAGHRFPRFYVTVNGFPPHSRARVHDSLTGRVLRSVPVPSAAGVLPTVTAARDDRTFLIASQVRNSQDENSTRLSVLRIAAGGRSVTIARLPIMLLHAGTADVIDGIALSPDGVRLAVAIQIPTTGFRPRGEIAVFPLHGGPARTWTVHRDAALPWDPAWASGGRRLTFLWWDHLKGPVTNFTARTQVRELDTSAPGRNLMASRVIATGGGSLGFIQTAIGAPGGHEILASAYRNIPAAGQSGAATVRLVALSASTGRVLRVLSSRTVHYRGLSQQNAADLSCQVFTVDDSGRHALISCPRTGRLDNGTFTRLRGSAGGLGVAASW
jgi:hypothetical protein